MQKIIYSFSFDKNTLLYNIQEKVLGKFQKLKILKNRDLKQFRTQSKF